MFKSKLDIEVILLQLIWIIMTPIVYNQNIINIELHASPETVNMHNQYIIIFLDLKINW